MNKAVLISIQPKWCEKIARGEKTIEVRKTQPKLKPPFKCYIYCTASGITAAERDGNIFTDLRCKVIGEFICKSFTPYCNGRPIDICRGETIEEIERQTCLSREDILEYAPNGNPIGWHISDLVIYDKPKELGEFYKVCHSYGADFGICGECENAVGEEYTCGVNGQIAMTQPPQSWCYVGEI